jgi:hypothetical protein
VLWVADWLCDAGRKVLANPTLMGKSDEPARRLQTADASEISNAKLLMAMVSL